MRATRPHSPREQGQAIILIVFIFVGLLVAVGLVIDLGRYLAAGVQLRRAVDSAALAGASQFRLTSSSSEADIYDNIKRAAKDTLRAHGVPTITIDSIVDTQIDTRYSDSAMQTNPPTKKVRVRVTNSVPLIFLRLVGWESVSVYAESTTEAAAVDVALLLDISDSMANDLCTGGDYPCAHTCDVNFACHPFEEVRSAALSFLDFLAPEFDRVTVIPFAREAGYCINVGDVWPDCAASAYDPSNGKFGDKYVPLTTKIQDARDFITALRLGIPEWAGDPPTYPIPECPGYNAAESWDPRQCTNTNIGGGIRAAATELLKEFDPTYPVPNAGENHPSKERLRVIILLTDGAANASGLGADGPTYGTSYQFGFCPQYTWYPSTAITGPFCRAPNPGLAVGAGRHISGDVEYDAVDYALDWGDFAFLDEPAGNSIVMFSIGLGNAVVSSGLGQPDIGEQLLRYYAASGDDANAATDPCAGVSVAQSCGNYYFAPSGDQLLDIFRAIAGRIFTRINK